MLRKGWISLVVLLASSLALWGATTAVDVSEVSLGGKVVNQEGAPVMGATVTAFTDDMTKSISVYSQKDGGFLLNALPASSYKLRARLIGMKDAWLDLGTVEGSKQGLKIAVEPATDRELQLQRPANNLIAMLEWPNEADALNFKMMCAYCHQVGTLGFRSPEEPVDWEVMLTRMDGFAGLYEHTREVLVDKVVAVYGREAEAKWPAYEPPPPPSGADLQAEVTEWQMGKEDDAMIHDLEIGSDGLIYAVDMVNDAIETLNPATGERQVYSLPGGKEYDSVDRPIKGPHSIERGPDGNMWVTLALSGQMGMFDVKTKEWRVASGHEAPRPRSGYPHTLRFAPNGQLFWTDAALGVFSLDPASWDGERWTVKYYKLPSADQVRGTGSRGESRGVTPYGIDVAPNGHVWYGKLNGQRVGRIIPDLPDDDPNKIVEWQPPVHGPRRLHVAPDGLVWVPGWASGNFASFNPETEEWKVYDLPHGADSLPYALNINPQTGDIWICGTGTDSMVRFDPKTEKYAEYRMPTRVTYTREVEFDDQGNAWICNSNYPVRHVENHHGSLIRVRVL